MSLKPKKSKKKKGGKGHSDTKKKYPTEFIEREGYSFIVPILREMGYKPTLSKTTTGSGSHVFRKVYTDKPLSEEDFNKAYKKVLNILM